MKRLLMLVAAVTPVLITVLFIALVAPAPASAQNYGPPAATDSTGPIILDLSGKPLPGGGNGAYQQYTADFTATQTSATIMFAFRDDPAAISFANVSVIDLTANSPVALLNNDFSQGTVGSTPNSWAYANVTGQSQTYQGVVATGPTDCYTELYCWFDGSQQGYDTISQTIPSLIVGHNYQISFFVAEGSFCSTNGAGLTCNFSDTSSTAPPAIAGIDVVVYVQGGTPVGSQTLTLALLDGGTGTVTDNVGTLTASNCYEAGGTVFQNGSAQASGTCTATYPVGTQVTLTATPNVPSATNPPSTFGAAATGQSQAIPGWGGVCPNGKNGNTCNITMNSAEGVTAAFVEPGLASSQNLSTDPQNPTTFPFNGGFTQGSGGFDFTGFLTDGTPSTTGVVNALSTDPATCNAIIDAAFPGSHCFVYQLGPTPNPSVDSAQMFEFTCPTLPGGTCGSVAAASFFATLGSDFSFDVSSENTGLSTTGTEPTETLLYNGGNPYVGVVKFEGPDPFHPCYLPTGQTAPSPTNQVISFTFIDGGTGAKPVKSGSGGTGSCWIIAYNMFNEVPTVSITSGPTDGQDIGVGTPLSATFTCHAVNNSNVSVGGQPVGAVGPYLTVNSCVLTDTYTVAGNPVTDTITATAGAASATGSGSLDTTNPGPHTVVSTIIDSAENTVSTSTITYNVQGSSTTTVTSSANPSTYGKLITFTATVSGVGIPTGQVTWTGIPDCVAATPLNSSGIATCSTSSLAASGTPYPVTTSYSGDNFNSTSPGTLVGGQVVNPASQSITFTTAAPASLTVGGATYTPMATGGASGLAVIISLDATSMGCSLSGGVVTATAAGTCIVDANQAANSNYSAAPQVQQSFAINKANQTVTFTTANPGSLTVGGATYTPMATGGASGVAVIISLDGSSTGCSFSGGVVTATAAGTCVVDANQGGNDSYNAAPPVQQSFTINKANQTITWTSTAPASLTVGGGTYTPMATGGASGIAVVISLGPSSTGCSLSGGVITATALGTCVIDANQGGNNSYNAAPQVVQSFAVNKANQTVVFTTANPGSLTVGGATYTPTATATSGLAAAVTLDAFSTGCSLSGGVVTAIATGTCVVDANQAGNSSYNAAPQVQQSFVINKANQTVKFTSTAPASLTVGGTTYTPTATATSGLAAAITLDASSTGCSLSGGVATGTTAGGTCIIDANQAGNNSYNAAPQVQQSFPVVAPPAWSVTPANYAFPTSSAGQSPSYTFTVTNPVGGATTSIYVNVPDSGNEGGSTPREVDPDDYVITSNGCRNVSLAGGQSCNVTVTWYPDNNDLGASLAYLQVTNSQTKKVLAYATMTGTAIDPTVAVTPANNSFTSTSTVTQMVATVANLSNQPTALILGNLSISGGSKYFKLASGSSSCANNETLVPGASCNVYVTFTPPGSGTVTGQVNIPSNAANGTQTVSLSGKRK